MFTKDPEAVLDYGIDWSSWLGADTISESSWSAPTPVTVPPLAIKEGSESHGDTATSVWLQGGVAGRSYSIVNHITTAAGREDDRELLVLVIDK